MTQEHLLTQPKTARENTYLISKTGEASTYTIGTNIGLQCPACNTLNALKPEKLREIKSNDQTVLGTVKKASPVIPQYNWMITKARVPHIKPYCSEKCRVTAEL